MTGLLFTDDVTSRQQGIKDIIYMWEQAGLVAAATTLKNTTSAKTYLVILDE